MTEQFHSEDGTDAWLVTSGLLPESGTYVDAGCAHPFRYSQTAFLRARGWTGLAIDGDPAYAPEWENIPNAKFVNAVLSDQPTAKFLIEPTNSLVSRVHAIGRDTPAYTLREIMESNTMFSCDLLAIDIEGSEVPVLRDYLISRSLEACPKIIVAEYHSCHKGRDVELFNLMAQTPYRLVLLTDSNAVYAR